MTFVTRRLAPLLLGVGLVAAAALPRIALAQMTETAVPVGPAAVGTGPNGATLRCRDGHYPAPGAPDAACTERGGVLVRFPLRRVPSRAAAAQAEAARASQDRRASRTATARSATESARGARPDSARPAGFEPYAVRRARADSLNRVASTPPEGATILCSDGTWIVRDTTQTRCASRGGVRVILPPRP